MQMLLIILTVLSSFLANLESKTLQSDFIVTVAEEADAPMNYPGSITMQGRQFALSMLGMEAAFDGKTMYMYTADRDELSLTNPSEQELVEANPFLYARALTDVCEITEREASQDKTPVTVITLTPRDQSFGINRFTLKVRTADLAPLLVEIKEGKKISTLKLNNPKFVPERQQYTIEPSKDTFVNDMRL